MSDYENSWVIETLEEAANQIDLFEMQTGLGEKENVGAMRRRRRRKVDDSIQVMSLIEKDGILSWESGQPTYLPPGRRRGTRSGLSTSDKVLKQFKFERLEPNQINQYLERLDTRLMKGNSGIRKWDGTQLVPNAKPAKSGYILLLVHGTFSNGDNFIGGVNKTSRGRQFLSDALETYDQVLVFDHPTLSVSPFHNAMDLREHFRGSNATVDVIAHSRGGLVTRSWFELFLKEEQCGAAVLVGSPLAGTGLAAPPNIRSTIKLLTNVGKLLGKAAGATGVPLLVGAAGLMRVVTSITSFAANTPLVDATVAMIPGLNAQSMVSNNQDLLRLHRGADDIDRMYYAITSDFEPTDPGWKFWKYFTNPKAHGLNFVADKIFDGPNDLVVDTQSMTQINAQADNGTSLKIPSKNTFAYKKNPTVHHLNYFEQKQTFEKLHKWLL